MRFTFSEVSLYIYSIYIPEDWVLVSEYQPLCWCVHRGCECRLLSACPTREPWRPCLQSGGRRWSGGGTCSRHHSGDRGSDGPPANQHTADTTTHSIQLHSGNPPIQAPMRSVGVKLNCSWGKEKVSLVVKVSSLQGLICMQEPHVLGERKGILSLQRCPHYRSKGSTITVRARSIMWYMQ